MLLGYGSIFRELVHKLDSLNRWLWANGPICPAYRNGAGLLLEKLLNLRVH